MPMASRILDANWLSRGFHPTFPPEALAMAGARRHDRRRNQAL